MAYSQRHHNIPPNRKKWVFGTLLIIIGLLLLLQNLDILPFNIPMYIFSWKMVPLVFGIVSLLKGRWFPALFFLGLATFLLAPQLFHLPVADVHKFWPILLIFLGLSTLTRRKKNCTIINKSAEKPGLLDNTTDVEGYLNNSAVFGGISRKISSDNFKGGSLNAVFGGIELDLSACRISPEDSPVYLDVNAVFGGVSLTLPQRWNVITQVNPVMGGFEDNKFANQLEREYTGEIVFTGNVVCGGIEIKRA